VIAFASPVTIFISLFSPSEIEIHRDVNGDEDEAHQTINYSYSD
jgi:subtilisin-like proprotein convertase family protein